MLKRLNEFINLFSKGVIYGNVVNCVGIGGAVPGPFEFGL